MHNPATIQGIHSMEFSGDSSNTKLEELLVLMGFSESHRSIEKVKKKAFSQSHVHFVVNKQDTEYFLRHGEGVSRITFLVDSVEEALDHVLKEKAVLKEDLKIEKREEGTYKRAAIQGIGDVLNEFIEVPKHQVRTDFLHPSFEKWQNHPQRQPLKQSVSIIDHLTNNVPFGQMDHFVDFYQRMYGFEVTRYFDIKGQKTGLFSKVVQLPNGKVIIPINEPDVENGKSQIQEFLDLHKGPGVQHIAFLTQDIYTVVEELGERGCKFLKTPSTYYQDIPGRKIHHHENISDLQKLNLLIDGDEAGCILQIFTETYIGPLFFEYIERKHHRGFGEGNFKALFLAMEREQKERGYL